MISHSSNTFWEVKIICLPEFPGKLLLRNQQQQKNTFLPSHFGKAIEQRNVIISMLEISVYSTQIGFFLEFGHHLILFVCTHMLLVDAYAHNHKHNKPTSSSCNILEKEEYRETSTMTWLGNMTKPKLFEKCRFAFRNISNIYLIHPKV